MHRGSEPLGLDADYPPPPPRLTGGHGPFGGGMSNGY